MGLALMVVGCTQVQSGVEPVGQRVEVTCDVVVGGSVGDVSFAELGVPGASAEQLEGTMAVGFPRMAASDYLQDFDRIAGLLVFVKDGAVSTMCGSAADAPLYDRVAFILPSEVAQ